MDRIAQKAHLQGASIIALGEVTQTAVFMGTTGPPGDDSGDDVKVYERTGTDGTWTLLNIALILGSFFTCMLSIMLCFYYNQLLLLRKRTAVNVSQFEIYE